MVIHDESAIRVPDQLSPLIDDEFLATHETWRDISLDDVRADMPEPVDTPYGRAVILDPGHDRDDSQTVVLGLPHQQAWKPSMYIRAEYTRQQVAPEARMIVLPNNTIGDSYYTFGDQESQAIRDGNLKPYYEQKVKLLESLDVTGAVDLSGYSLGGLTVLGIAGISSDRFQIQMINSDEAPNLQRDAGSQRKDFMESGGWAELKAAIADSDIPVLAEALSTPRLASDFARYGLATMDAVNRALQSGMGGESFTSLTGLAALRNPGVTIKVGHIAGSKVFQAKGFDLDSLNELMPDANIRHVTYNGRYARSHPTGDNVAAHALMLLDAKRGTGVIQA